jgi:hypothetical protein
MVRFMVTLLPFHGLLGHFPGQIFNLLISLHMVESEHPAPVAENHHPDRK